MKKDLHRNQAVLDGSHTKRNVPYVVIKIPRQARLTCLKDVDIIDSHNQVVEKHGKVLFGRAGRSFAAAKLRTISEAIEDRVPTRLVIIRKDDDGYIFWQASMLGIWDASHEPDFSICPIYYKELAPLISLWMEIGRLESVGRDQMSRITLSSTGRPILELLESQASLMLAELAVL